MNEQPSARHLAFLDDVVASRPSTFAVAYWLHSRGFDVLVPAFRYAPTAEDAVWYADDGDVLAIKAGQCQRIEVKGLDRDFTCMTDWPFFERSEVFVDTARKIERLGGYERAGTTVAAFFSVSRDLKYAAIISGSTWRRWYPTRRFNKRSQRLEEYIACPLWDVEFRCLLDGGNR